MKPKTLCLVGLFLFVTSYVFFSQGSLGEQKHIDLAHWFNLIGAVLLINFNNVFPKNRLNSIASVLTAIGVIAHIGLCTIDFIMWSFGNDNVGRNELREQISNTPLILYPFVIVGPSFLFVGLAAHALNFIKTNPIGSLMVIIGGPFVGLSYFIWNNGILMLISCIAFASGLGGLLYRNEIQNVKSNELQQDI
ncbi:hypothetical protein ATE84_3631 [Aquimarina sp. MAR_2010_214]|uniref:hypothetical protein n=1 Tax=Aquimarina sp. MAR_2010_214 TaxID=1250026 RepID=UPI000C7125D7|nr:hypothetical protein [Aquimarina sp. MAR_2010_214]PKV51545.1 hypothetical protein ATE84_3631 [Aquimarina sp. MAR_2010_214]